MGSVSVKKVVHKLVHVAQFQLTASVHYLQFAVVIVQRFKVVVHLY